MPFYKQEFRLQRSQQVDPKWTTGWHGFSKNYLSPAVDSGFLAAILFVGPVAVDECARPCHSRVEVHAWKACALHSPALCGVAGLSGNFVWVEATPHGFWFLSADSPCAFLGQSALFLTGQRALWLVGSCAVRCSVCTDFLPVYVCELPYMVKDVCGDGWHTSACMTGGNTSPLARLRRVEMVAWRTCRHPSRLAARL